MTEQGRHPASEFHARQLGGSVVEDLSSYDHRADIAQPRKFRAGWIIAIVGVLAVALLTWHLATPKEEVPQAPTTSQLPDPASGECPERTSNKRAKHPKDERVYGGNLSYPRLGAPYDREAINVTRVPFGRDLAMQDYMNHKKPQWGTAALVGELYAGGEFYEPVDASTIFHRCIIRPMYGSGAIPETLRSEPYTLGGYDGWITETRLSISVPDLAVTSEWLIVIIIKISPESSSFFLATVPDDLQDLEPEIWATIADLRIHT